MINSSSTKILPEDVKEDALVKEIVVPEPPVPFESFNKAPFKVVKGAPNTSPPKNPVPKP